jgi:general secretion pathway protein G
MGVKKRGFTILELLAVMVIIAILTGLGAKGYNLARRKSKETRAKADIEKLRTTLEEYRVKYGNYPVQDPVGPFGNLSDIDFLTNSVEGVSLVDPWGNEYRYYRDSDPRNRFLYKIWSEGQDASDGTEDDIDPSQAGY